VRRAARNVRDRRSLDAWRAINRLEGFADLQAGDPLEVLDETLFTLSAFSGLAMESMTRGLGWRFMDMGRRVERAMNQTRLIRYGLARLCTETTGALESLLEVSDGIMTYRARYRTAFQLSPVLDLLDAYRFVFTSPLVSIFPEAKAFAQSAFVPDVPILTGALNLIQHIYPKFEYDDTATSIDTSEDPIL